MTRLIRKHIWGQPQRVELRFPRGFAAEAERELRRVLDSPLQEYSSLAAVDASEDQLAVDNIHFRQIYELLFRLRCVREILWLLTEKRVGSYGELKKAVQSVPWSLIGFPGMRVALRVRSLGSRLFHETGIAEAIAEELTPCGIKVRPQTEADTVVECVIEQNRLRILIGCFGRAAYRRGYKENLVAIAPLREDLAAALLERLSPFVEPTRQISKSLLVPFAGSGTLVVEGLLSLANLPPGILGRTYAYERFACAPAQSNALVKERLRQRREGIVMPSAVIAIEQDEKQAAALQDNLDAAWKLFRDAEVELPNFSLVVDDLFDYKPEPITAAVIPLNPPFGERLKGDSSRLYGRLGTWVKKSSLPGSAGFVLAAAATDTNLFANALGKSAVVDTSGILHGGKNISSCFFETSLRPKA